MDILISASKKKGGPRIRLKNQNLGASVFRLPAKKSKKTWQLESLRIIIVIFLSSCIFIKLYQNVRYLM